MPQSKMELRNGASRPRYWGEAFMYAVHIRNLSPTSALRDIVPVHAWSGRKPDISHLRIFGSMAYANIPKKVRGGKLEVTSIKCRLLGWWADETKGYRLEEVETRKLIAARDIKFVEDTKPDDLAVIEGDEPRRPVDNLVDSAPPIYPHHYRHLHQPQSPLSHPTLNLRAASNPKKVRLLHPQPLYHPYQCHSWLRHLESPSGQTYHHENLLQE